MVPVGRPFSPCRRVTSWPSLASLTAAVQEIPYAPSRLGDLGIFAEKPINTLVAMVESEGGVLTLGFQFAQAF